MKHFYKKLIYSTFLALGSTYIQAQTTTENFIKTQECLDATCATKKETVVYFDGLGREKQALQVAGSPTGKTIVTQIEYDGFGRQAKENLPFPITAATNTIVSAATNGNTFYSTLTGDTTPFSEKTFENSPLNRVLAQAAPGNSWKKGANEIKFDYATNTDADKVQKFGVTLSAAFVPTLTLSGNYTAGTLYKTVTIDENGQPIQEFKDKEGKIILKRINIPAISGTTNSSGNHDTYYVYDIYGNLTYVIPPKLVEVGTTVLANYTANLAELGYQYQYDDKNRLVEKQLPGKGREFMVYDKLDRLVATRDSQNEWIFTKYDKFNRIVYTGTLPTSARATLQSAYNTATIYHETRGTSGGLANNGITNGLYTNVAYPTSFTKITTINYYDEYTNLGITPSSIDGQSVIGVTDTKTKGLAVASFTNVLGTTIWAKNYTYYDAKYIRPVATASTNYLGGYTNTASSLDFRGKPLKTITKHKQLAASTELTLTDEFVYYPNELLKSQTHQINSGAKEYIVQNSYNEINQLTIKKVGNSVATTPLQTVDYKYNIRGWMTDINNVDVTETTTYRDLFSFRLNYDKLTRVTNNTAVKKLHNGNIAEIIWKTIDFNTRSYSFEYDGLNRLMNSIYLKNTNEAINAYNETIKGYDKNGNITGIIRNGNNEIINAPVIDNLSYVYQTNSNKLLSVTDATTLTEGFNDGNKVGNDYAYDVNGNLTVDKNKGITKISYNYLNLPTEVLWNASKKINYTYDASGVKLRKVVTDGTRVITTDYLGGFQYQNNVLQFFPTAEGYVNVTNGTAFNYVYNYTDHLGNVRLSYQKEANGTLKVLEENNYYPFGLKHKGYNNTNLANANYKYKYNGKELQDELSLNLYDYGARNYDPAIGRWFNIDPLAEKSRRFSPYTYALNNPVFFIDPDGMMATPPDWVVTNGQTLYDSRVKSQSDATSIYGSNAKHVANGTSYTASDTGNNVTLQDKGYFVSGGKNGAVQDQALLAMYDNKSVTGVSTLNPKDDALYSGSVRRALGNRDVNGQNLIEAGQMFQTGGDAATVAGLGMSATGVGAVAGGPLTVIGGITSNVGLATEISGDFIKNGFNKQTIFNNSLKLGLSFFFKGLSKNGVNATRAVAGREAVQAGENRVSEAVIEGTVMGAEKTTDKFLNYKK
ncbi:DUF6443 domain-containing protein [Empedobacter falsenii]|uniref:DUF6443 domain-containing protein n=1 Tax=Empedobacter falsenii TaxID=343874 RepID=UPI001C565789|nr:DUF6443 domain-containing protein [Empedobacter falsenii]MBW1619818.1 RHS repeat-associated core domain-containing protein [Empedobacter falsenii]